MAAKKSVKRSVSRKRQLIRWKQPAVTRIIPHQGNKRFIVPEHGK